MNYSTILTLLILICAILVEGQRSALNMRRPMSPRPMNRASVGRRNGPIPPSRQQFARRNNNNGRVLPPGFKPPTGIAKKLNDATDFRALARVLLKH
ncbi:unnamed protein product [Caenorhabditis angaria]|uniref:Uncharacterized protein n=1 Tax=Caenorhabditis angaria TaxID=860376 RepID=A0A9P1IIL4_9PELO|nr:unnamed protein product [Caenorhabditis angaria]